MTVPVTVERGIKRPRRVRRLVRSRLAANGLTPEIAACLEVTVTTKYRSQTTASVSGVKPNYRAVSIRMYLNPKMSGIESSVVGHEYGHAWAYYNLYLRNAGEWGSYLDARDLAGNPKLDTSYQWDKDEIIADDYRLLFGSDESRKQWPYHAINRELPDPRNVPGLREFLSEWGREKVAA